MSRVVIGKKDLIIFFNSIKDKSSKSWDELGTLVNVSGRTLRDWRRGVLLADKDKLEKLSKLFAISVPKIVEEKEDYWSAKKFARKAAMIRLKKYGPPGTPEGRRKGGLISQQRRRENPEYYRKLGVNIRNRPRRPRFSKKLAEFIGIVLGDGSLTKDQCFIHLNLIKDKNYAKYVEELIFDLFDYKCSKYRREKYGVMVLMVAGRNFIEFLESIGLRVGNKVKNQVDIPLWIKKNKQFSIYCLRGLIDTDGGVFRHRYLVNNKKYCYIKICFVNKSKPLLKFAFKTLKNLNLKPKFFGDRRVWLYSQKQVLSYMRIVGSSNARLLNNV